MVLTFSCDIVSLLQILTDLFQFSLVHTNYLHMHIHISHTFYTKLHIVQFHALTYSHACCEILVPIVHFSVINLEAVPQTESYVALSAVNGSVLLRGLASVMFPSVRTNLTCTL
jgi:hypothetical protein